MHARNRDDPPSHADQRLVQRHVREVIVPHLLKLIVDDPGQQLLGHAASQILPGMILSDDRGGV